MKRLNITATIILGFVLGFTAPAALRADGGASTASGDFSFARDTYDEVLGRLQYDNTALERQLDFNRKRERELQEALIARERFLSSLPRRMGAHLSRLRDSGAAGNEDFLEEAAGEFQGNYTELQREALEDRANLERELAAVRMRIAALRSRIEMREARRDLRIVSGGEGSGGGEASPTAVAFLEGVAREAMQEELGALGRLEVSPVTRRDSYRSGLLSR